MTTSLPSFIELSVEVSEALSMNRPVVALESTIITHGMPYPQNLRCALEVEEVVRQGGSTPATIAILEGRIKVGLTEEDINVIAEKGPEKCSKVSIRDIGLVMANKGYGSTTVAATMRIAALAGIRVFATGGIGGVHRGAESTWDVSADLTELGSNPVAVVCAGAKSVLDLPKTLEFLETQGVPVLGWGTDIFPAFFTRDSGLRTSGRVDDAEHAAKFLTASDRFFSAHQYRRPGCIIACPVPEAGAADMAKIESCTQRALKEADNKGIQGAAVTPFLLKRINELTGGESLAANLCLIKNNAMIASTIALAYSKVSSHQKVASGPRAVAVLGGIAMDITAKASDPTSAGAQESTVPGFLTMSSGGVGLSLAECMAMLGATPGIISAVGRDSNGDMLIQRLREIGVPSTNVKQITTESTGTCTLVLDGRGELISGVAAMDIFDRLVHPLVNIPKILRQDDMSQLRVLLVDANIPRDTITRAAKACRSYGIECWIDPVSTVKAAARVAKAKDTGEEVLDSVDLISPNMHELAVLASSYLYPSQLEMEPMRKDDVIRWGLTTAQLLLEKSAVRRVLASFGKHGVLLVTSSDTVLSPLPSKTTPLTKTIGGTLHIETLPTASSNTTALHYIADPIDNMVSSTGAGDNLLAGTAWAHGCRGVPIEKAVMVGMACARMSLFSESACHPALSSDEVEHLISSSSEMSKL
ncbi:hypothetical protein FOL47_000050 [Perkinsus chesapeaki]|uniref:Carbohydrate kinase PfkB domain-containing protein n=1 Tax=Perkinsus chesapeaki TaxID=330153 RepID=A0A7J6N5Z3_PERCH|nr:hypothetical protein FOL47_000050 [Perkinsus chesapeaki]